jgi:hypothetical protein
LELAELLLLDQGTELRVATQFLAQLPLLVVVEVQQVTIIHNREVMVVLVVEVVLL